VKFRTDILTQLVEADDPVESVWGTMWEIWSPAAESVTSHYEREDQMVQYEKLLLDVYEEFYADLLPTRCVNDASLDIPEDGTFVVMDAMSVREAGLLVNFLRDQGYDPSVGYSFASVPSETTPYRDRVGYSELKREYKLGTVKSDDPSLDGDEDIVWCRFPDALLENIQEGKTKLSSIEEMYEKTEQTFGQIISQLDSDRIVVGSDHGYVRLDAGHTFPVTEPQKNRLQETFSGRFVSVAEANADDLVTEGLVVESDGYYMPIGRYTWPTRGKYSTFTHGGLSLAESIIPRITFHP
jgi:hypothetical protein